MRTNTIGLAALFFVGITGCGSARAPLAPLAPQAPQASAVVKPAPTCRVLGPTFVVAPNVYLGDVHIEPRRDAGFDVVVMDGVDPCMSVGVDAVGNHLGTTLVKCPPSPADARSSASNGIATYVARETSDRGGRDGLMLGVVTYDSDSTILGVSHAPRARVVEHSMIPATPEGARDPVLANYGGEGFALAWVQGGEVRVQPVQGWAELVGTPINVAPPTTGELGPPALVFDRHGVGLVAFAAQSPSSMDVVVTPIACSL